MDEILAAARSADWRALGDRALCDACLGRLFGRLGHGLTNQDRGRAVREVALIADGPCWVCAGLTGRYDDLAGLVARKLGPWEFETFRVGSKIDFEMAAREESLWAELALTGPEAWRKWSPRRSCGNRAARATRCTGWAARTWTRGCSAAGDRSSRRSRSLGSGRSTWGRP